MDGGFAEYLIYSRQNACHTGGYMISYRFHVPDHIHSAEKRELERQDEIDERNRALPPPNSMKTIDNRGECITS